MGNERKYIAYYRVSTKKQGESKLGLESQKAVIQDFTKGAVIAEYTDIASGKGIKNRPQLELAIRHSKESGAVLVVANVDRLSRDVKEGFDILDRLGEQFLLCCDCPVSDRIAFEKALSFAQQEIEEISKRIILALQAAKARGVKLGNKKGCDISPAVAASLKVRKEKAKKINAPMVSTVSSLREAGKSWQWISDFMNKPEQPSPPKGGQWNRSTIFSTYKRHAVDLWMIRR